MAQIAHQISPTFLILSILIFIFIAAVVFQLCFAFLLRAGITTPSGIQKDWESLPVSVIICAKNEAHNLQQFLPFVLEQDYPEDLFEVIVVNDQSTDHSAQVLQDFASGYPRLNVVTIEQDRVKTFPGKKYALSQGIAAAKFEQLLLTDADCKPASGQWLRQMTGSGKSIVLGYGAYETHPGMLNKFIRWETVHTCMQYAGYARKGLAYMGVGRNLSYRKVLLEGLEQDQAFQQVYRNTPSGDDDLLICKIARKDNVTVCLDREAHTLSVPQRTWATWWRQKTRHTSTGKYYPGKIKKLLGLYALSHCLYWLLGITLLILAGIADNGSLFSIWNIRGCLIVPDTLTVFLITLFLLRLGIYWILAATWYRQLHEKKLLLFYPLGDLGWALYNVFLSPYIFWKNRQAWK